MTGMRGSALTLGLVMGLGSALAPHAARADGTPMRDRVIILAVVPPLSALIGGGLLIAQKSVLANARSEADALAATKPKTGSPCAPAPTKCSDIAGNLHLSDGLRDGAITGFVVAGLAAVFGVGLVADGASSHVPWTNNSPARKTSLRLTVAPVVSQNVGGALLVGQF